MRTTRAVLGLAWLRLVGLLRRAGRAKREPCHICIISECRYLWFLYVYIENRKVRRVSSDDND